MKANQLLRLIIKETALKGQEKEIENLFLELVGWLILKELHHQLTASQRSEIKERMKGLALDVENANLLLTNMGIDTPKAELIVNKAIKEAFLKTIESLGENLSVNSKNKIISYL